MWTIYKEQRKNRKFKETGDSPYIYQNELVKVYFQHDMAYGDFKYLARRTNSDKVLRDKAFNIAKNPKYDGYEKGLPSVVYKSLDKTTSGEKVKNEKFSNKELPEELHKPIIRKFNRGKVKPPFIDNICGADLDDMPILSKFIKNLDFYYMQLTFLQISTGYSFKR